MERKVQFWESGNRVVLRRAVFSIWGSLTAWVNCTRGYQRNKDLDFSFLSPPEFPLMLPSCPSYMETRGQEACSNGPFRKNSFRTESRVRGWEVILKRLMGINYHGPEVWILDVPLGTMNSSNMQILLFMFQSSVLCGVPACCKIGVQ